MTNDNAKRNSGATVFRLLAGLIGLFFLALGIGFMAFPDTFATGFSVQPAYVPGLNAIRGNFGGLFLGMGLFCLVGAMAGRSRWLIVPVIFVILIMVGRLISLGLDGFSEAGTQSLKMEALFVVVLAGAILALNRRSKTGEKGFTLSEILNARVLIGVVCVAFILAGLLLARKQIGMIVVDRVATRIMAANAVAGLPDGLHVVLIGTGAPFADPRRGGPSTGVIAGKNLYLVDAGPSSERKLELMKIRPEDVRAVLLTHFHSDHIGDLGELMLKRWAGGSMKTPLDVFGPEGVETVVKGFNLAYSLDTQYRIAHHGPEVVPPSGAGGMARTFQFPADKKAMVIIEADGLKVTAFEVDHTPVKPAVGYRFDYKGRSVVISGDTVPCLALLEQSRGADILVQEALQPAMVGILKTTGQKINRPKTAEIMGDILNYHTSPEDAAKLAREAGVRHLVLSHLLPPLPVADLKPVFLGDAKKGFSGPITIAEDGMLFSLPEGNKKIIQKSLF